MVGDSAGSRFKDVIVFCPSQLLMQFKRNEEAKIVKAKGDGVLSGCQASACDVFIS